MGNGVVQALKKEFDIQDEWVSYEIHPETPLEGMSMEERFSKASVQSMYERLQEMGEPYGVKFGKMSKLSNSRLALEASEFARDQGKFHDFHEAVFQAYFTDGQDIGDTDLLLALGKKVGLDTAQLGEALADHRYEERLQEAQQQGAAYGVTGTPTCIINGKYRVVGAQSIEVFRQTLQKIEQLSAQTGETL